MSDFGEQHQVQPGSRNSTSNRNFAHDAVFWSRTPSILLHPNLKCPNTLQYTFEIASISVLVFELLVLPVCTWWCSPESYGISNISTATYHRLKCRPIGRAWKHCRNRRHHSGIVLRRQIITTSGIHPPSWTSAWRKRLMRLAYIGLPVKNLPPETIRYSHWDCVDICFLC